MYLSVLPGRHLTFDLEASGPCGSNTCGGTASNDSESDSSHQSKPTVRTQFSLPTRPSQASHRPLFTIRLEAITSRLEAIAIGSSRVFVPRCPTSGSGARTASRWRSGGSAGAGPATSGEVEARPSDGLVNHGEGGVVSFGVEREIG